MESQMMMFPVFLCLWYTSCLVNGESGCKTFCVAGRFCDQLDCHPCPKGQFRNEPSHSETLCTDWTPRPAGQHWELKRHGTSISDQVWDCEDGYTQNYHSSLFTEKVCVLVNVNVKLTAPSTTTNSTEISKRSESNDSKLAEVIGGVVGGVLLVLVLGIGILIYCCKKRKQQRMKKSEKPYSSDNDTPSNKEQEFVVIKEHMAKSSKLSNSNVNNSDEKRTSFNYNDVQDLDDSDKEVSEDASKSLIEHARESPNTQTSNATVSDEASIENTCNSNQAPNGNRCALHQLVHFLLLELGKKDTESMLDMIGASYVKDMDMNVKNIVMALVNWEQNNPDQDLMEALGKEGKVLYPECFESRDYEDVLQQVKGYPAKEKNWVEGELKGKDTARKLFTYIFQSALPDKREDFLYQLKIDLKFGEGFMSKQLGRCGKEVGDYAKCGVNWFKCHPRYNHVKCIKDSLRSNDLFDILRSKRFNEYISEKTDEVDRKDNRTMRSASDDHDNTEVKKLSSSADSRGETEVKRLLSSVDDTEVS